MTSTTDTEPEPVQEPLRYGKPRSYYRNITPVPIDQMAPETVRHLVAALASVS